MVAGADEFEGSEISEHMRTCPKCRELLKAWSQARSVQFGPERGINGGTLAEDPNDGTLADGPDDDGTLVERPDDSGNLAEAPAPSAGSSAAKWSDSSQTVESMTGEPSPAQAPASPSDESTTWGDSPQTPDRVTPGPSAANAAASPADTVATLAEPSETVNSIAESSSAKTIDVPTGADAPFQKTMMFAPGQSTDSRSQSANFLQETAVFSFPGRPPSAAPSSDDTQKATIDNASASGATTDFGSELQPRIAKTLPTVFVGPASTGKNGPAEYELLGELGRGGMGVVYKARHRRLNRLVALKMIRGAYADEIQVARFKIEAEAVATLRHPNILQIYDIGEFNGSPYVALELLEGGSLTDRMKGTLLPPKQAAQWMVPLVLAMDTAHRAGIVHRDLKPANILFTADAVPKITDFGLAKRLEDDEGQTHTGQVMGTPSYMAPEQARGETKLAGPPADIYSLGAILYEMLTGRPPFKGVSAMDTVKQVLEIEPVSPSRVQFRVPRDLETICLKCLQKEARKRYPTAKEMADDLNRYLTGEPVRARRTPLVERGIKWTKRHPTAALASAVATVAMISLLGYGGWYWNNQRKLERVAQQQDAKLQKDTNDALLSAQEAISKNDLPGGHEALTAQIALLTAEPKKSRALTDLFDRTKLKLIEVERAMKVESARQAELLANEAVYKRYRLFLDRRKEALFRNTQFPTGVPDLTLPNNPDLTRKAAEEALAVFAQRGHEDNWTLGALPAALSSEQQAEVKDDCYELLLILAGAVANQGPGQVDRALRLVESADRRRPNHSRAYHLTKASLLGRKNDRAGEALELAQAQLSRPETAFDHFMNGQEEYKRHRPAEAILAFDSVLQQKPDHFWAQCQMANCYIQTARFEAAKACLNGCIKTEPDVALLYLLRGFASGRLGAKYLNLVKSSPGREAGLKASAEHEFDDTDKDFDAALKRLKSTPDDELHYVLLINRGYFSVQRGRLDQAAADYQEAIRLRTKDPLAYADLARVYQKQDKPDLAIEQFTRAIAVKPDWSPLYRGRADVLAGRADSTPEQRKAALSDLGLAILHEKPDDPVLILDHVNRGKLLYRDGRYEDALEESKLALRMVPDNLDAQVIIDAHVLQFTSLLKLDRFDEVIRSCDVVIEKGKKSAVIYEARGDAHAARHDYPAAIRDYGLALVQRPKDGRLLARRGWAYLVYESPKLALADFGAAIKLDRANSDFYCGRGTAYARLGDHIAAVADAREALGKGGADPRVIYNAARIYAIAASVAATELGGEKGRQARQLAVKYQDTAVQLVRKAFERKAPEERAPFWRDILVPDPAWKAISRRLRFEDLIATNK
jgi:tetratricopeptide (TPR) repeat protein/tRNA A-37 threonylcarbamoyl transferase component Bud32